MSDYERGNRSVGSIAAQIDRVLNRMLPADADKEAELWPLIYEYGHAAEVRASSQHVTESTETATEGREAVARWMIEHGYATGHGDTLDDLLTELASQERPSIDAERLAEAMHNEQAARDLGCGSPGESYDDHMEWHRYRAERIVPAYDAISGPVGE